ncbi:MAG: hypothetical protein ACPGSC_11000 [Granulosicoccaceae bacterium]
MGSFGEEVYKIGMTRRQEPLDRVKANWLIGFAPASAMW